MPSYPQRVLFYTQNTTRNPISWNPKLKKPNPNEILHAVHLALHRALDPCIEGAGEACSWTLEDVVEGESGSSRHNGPNEAGNGDSKVGEKASPSGGVTLSINTGSKLEVDKGCGCGDLDGLTELDAGAVDQKFVPTLFIPHPSHIKPSPVPSSANRQISVKLSFYGQGGADRVKEAAYALEQFSVATGFDHIDRLILSLPEVNWEGDEEMEKEGIEQVDELVSSGVWQFFSKQPHVQVLGVSDFSSVHLERLLSHLSSEGKDLRRPSVVQLKLESESGTLPPAYLKTSRNQNIEILSHSDDKVPASGIQTLINEFRDRIPLSPTFIAKQTSNEDAVEIRWTLKYTVILKERGLVADKGFIVSANLF